MGRETRLANKTQWALQDITSQCKDVRRDWDRAMALAERNLDPVMMQLLGRMLQRVGTIERKAILALNGEYDQEIEPER